MLWRQQLHAWENTAWELAMATSSSCTLQAHEQNEKGTAQPNEGDKWLQWEAAVTTKACTASSRQTAWPWCHDAGNPTQPPPQRKQSAQFSNWIVTFCLWHPQILSSLGLEITSYAMRQSGFQRTACQKNGQASNITRGQKCQYNNAKQF